MKIGEVLYIIVYINNIACCPKPCIISHLLFFFALNPLFTIIPSGSEMLQRDSIKTCRVTGNQSFFEFGSCQLD